MSESSRREREPETTRKKTRKAKNPPIAPRKTHTVSQPSRDSREGEALLTMLKQSLSREKTDVVLGAILTTLSDILSLSSASMMVCDDDTGCLKIHAAVGLEQRVIDSTKLRSGEGIAGYVMKERISVLVKDIEQEERFQPSLFSYHYPGRSFISVPVSFEKYFGGILNGTNCQGAEAFSENDLAFFEQTADIIGRFLLFRRHHDDVHNKVWRLEQINTDLVEVNRKLMQMDKQRSQVLSRIAHELNTPLTSIKAYAEMIEKIGLMPERIRSFMNLISTEIRRLIDLTSGLLDISKLYSRKMPLNRRCVAIYELLDQVSRLFEPQVKSKGLSFVLDIPDRTMTIWVDRDKVFQVLVNLLENSIKYSEQGTILVSAWKNDTKTVSILVRDQGIGIPESDLPQIFDEFYRVPSHHERGDRGSGLGLALVKSIIEAHDGQIDVESTVGTGTDFRLTFASEQS